MYVLSRLATTMKIPYPSIAQKTSAYIHIHLSNSSAISEEEQIISLTVGNEEANVSVIICPDALHVNTSICPGVSINT